MNVPQKTAQVGADVAAGISAGSAGYAWLGTANEVVQLLAGIVAIAAGIAALRFHLVKTKEVKKEQKERGN